MPSSWRTIIMERCDAESVVHYDLADVCVLRDRGASRKVGSFFSEIANAAKRHRTRQIYLPDPSVL